MSNKKPSRTFRLPSYAKLLELVSTQQEQIRAQEDMIETQKQILAVIVQQFPEVGQWIEQNAGDYPLFDDQEPGG